jgi:hypoxanthine phosphoribosyltransferase
LPKCGELSRKAQSSGQVLFKQIALPDVVGWDILVLDDILDTGFTLVAVRETLETAKPYSIRVCVLLSKKKQRTREVDTDYIGFEIEDEFVVGYGLDFRERYRNLPYIGVLRRELLEQPDK